MTIAVLRRAVELEVNFIDTADSSGPHVSETLIAEALYPCPDDLVIAIKGGLERTGLDQWPVNGRPEHLKSACDGSLQRLRLEQIPLYPLHRTESVSGRSGALRGTLSPDADRLIWARARQLNRSSRRTERGVRVHAGQGVTGD
jgi:aryl-alcohol dehydrogenase-like predicted oxidoreductase